MGAVPLDEIFSSLAVPQIAPIPRVITERRTAASALTRYFVSSMRLAARMRTVPRDTTWMRLGTHCVMFANANLQTVKKRCEWRLS